MDTDKKEAIREKILGCNPKGANPPAPHALCSKSVDELSYGTLNIAQPAAPEQPDEWRGCGVIEEEAQNGSFSEAKLRPERLSEYMTTPKLLELLATLQLEFDEDGNWALSQFDKRLMSSYDQDKTTLYPACACRDYAECRALAASVCPEVAGPWGKIFQAIPAPSLGSGQQMYEIGLMAQRAIWTIAAKAGRLPAGRIIMPVPIINTASALFDDLQEQRKAIPFQAIYHWGKFLLVNDDSYRLETGATVATWTKPITTPQVDPAFENEQFSGPSSGPSGPFEEDTRILGTARRMRPTMAGYLESSRVSVPDWLPKLATRALQAMADGSPDAFLTVKAKNQDVTFPAQPLEPAGWPRNVMTVCDGGAASKMINTQELAAQFIAGGRVCPSMSVVRDYSEVGGVAWYHWMRSKSVEWGAHSVGETWCGPCTKRPKASILETMGSLIPLANGGGKEVHAATYLPISTLDVHPDKYPNQCWEQGYIGGGAGGGGAGVSVATIKQDDAERNIRHSYSDSDVTLQSWVDVYDYMLPRKMSLPSLCSPDSRVSLMLSHGVGDVSLDLTPTTDCASASKMVLQMFGMACLATQKSKEIANGASPPPVRSEADIALYQLWLNRQASFIQAASAAQIFESIPQDVLAGSGTGMKAKGRQGELHYQLVQNIEQMNLAWRSAQSQFSKLSAMVDVLKADLRLAQIQGRRAEIDNELKDSSLDIQGLALEADLIELDRQQSLAAVRSMQRSFAAVSGAGFGAAQIAWGGPTSKVGGYEQMSQSVASWYFGGTEDSINQSAQNQLRANLNERRSEITKGLALIAEDNVLIGDQTATTIQRVFAEYAVSTVPIYEQLDAAVSQISQFATQIRSTTLEVQSLQNNAAYYAAGAAGADYFTDSDNQIVKIPVNTVLRRQYDVTRIRYEQSLDDAKRLAYLARLSIEQRLGVRLDQMNEPVGSLEAPKLWADKVCTLQGLDYKKLKDFDTDAGVENEKELVAQFADQYIGDYVAKLRSFMEFYGTAYPFSQGEDVAVLSLRSDLMQSDGLCLRDSRNILLNSDQLWERGHEGAGWVHRSCESNSKKCVIAARPLGLGDEAGTRKPPNPPNQFGGVTWLHDMIQEPVGAADAGVGNDSGTPASPSEPGGVIYQSVQLTAKNPYVLSWWDMERTATGVPAQPASHQADARYLVTVYDSEWNVLAQDMEIPFVNEGGDISAADKQLWSSRRALSFTAPATGWYRVAFRASLPGAPNGSVAIANVQLEEQPSGTNGAGPYEATLTTRQTVSGDCLNGGDASAFRAGFDHKCDPTGSCYYELRHPWLIDTRHLNDLTSKLVGKVAAGNYNYRNTSVALNVVGTGVLNCENQSNACYADGYLEYSMDHDAFRIPVENYSGQSIGFNFGSASINRGKSLAIERWITNPISSGDLGLLQQPQFTKEELRGRPLDGSYRLRVYDRPSLAWERVEDIQVVLKYRYWSRVKQSPN